MDTRFLDDMRTEPTPAKIEVTQPVPTVEASAEAAQVDEPQPAPRPQRCHSLESRGTVRKDNRNGPWVDKYGQRTDTKPLFDPPQKAVSFDPQATYKRNPNNRGSDESGRAMEVRGTKVVYKATGEEVKSGVESLSSFSTLVPGMTRRTL